MAGRLFRGSGYRRLVHSGHARKPPPYYVECAQLRVVLDGDIGVVRPLQGCYCVKQTLACTRIVESYEALPVVGLRGSQVNAYFTISQDRALVVKLQKYQADVILVAPIFRITEPWAHFERVAE